MWSKALGETGVRLPEIGLGTWDYKGGAEPLRRGLQAGALFIDTAESYGSEAVIAEVLRGQRERVFLATKVSRQHLRRADVLGAADRSLARLGTDYIDLYQIHEPTNRVPIEETLAAMEDLVDAGKVRFIGVSNFSLAALQRAQKVVKKHPIVSNQLRYNLVDRTIEETLLPYCQANKVTVIAYSPLGRQLQRICDCDPQGTLDRVAQAMDKTLPQILLNWCLCHDGVVAIPKGSSTEHILENCAASGWRLTPEQFNRLDNGVRFRRRTGAEKALRRLVPSHAAPMIKHLIQSLPPALRRRIQ